MTGPHDPSVVGLVRSGGFAGPNWRAAIRPSGEVTPIASTPCLVGLVALGGFTHRNCSAENSSSAPFVQPAEVQP